MRNDDILDRIYEAGSVPELWPCVLGDLAARFDGVGTVMIAQGGGAQRLAFSPGFGEVMSGFVEEGWSRRNQRLERATARRRPGFMTERDLFTEDELLADPMLAGFFLPRGIGGELGTVIATPAGDSLALTVQRRFADGPADVADVADADELQPHLARAALLSTRIGVDRARAIADALEAIGLPAAMLTLRGRPLAANALFRASMPAVATERRDRIALAAPEADALLSEALVRSAMSGAERVAASIPIGRSHLAPALIAHLVPVRRSAQDMFHGAASILLLVRALPHEAPDAALLASLFGLTPAEVRLCRALADGSRSVAEAAGSLGLSYQTARTQLRSVFGKTGTSRQAELVRVLTGLRRPG